ncbi:MAG: HAMP domain-containing histidine kinase, partial [Gammaproteobacteria bacterium]|nr:HAMP domain-containing histidine kinase [Gammaproteobacteria bacterium]
VKPHETIVFGLLTYSAWLFDQIYSGTLLRNSFVLYDIATLRLLETGAIVFLHRRIVMKNLKIKSMNRFLGVAAHDIRSPLAAIKSGLEHTVNYKFYDDDFLKVLISAADSSMNYSTNILNLAKSGSEKLKPNLEKINTNRIINKILSFFDLSANKKEISIIFRPQCEDVAISVDPILFEQALLNIIGNSIKFSPSKGEIFVESSIDDNYFEVTVLDHGSGIEQEKIENINKAFQIGRKNENSGFGLGLYIVSLVMDAHNGKLCIHSPIDGSGVGTRIKLSFPIT